MIRLLMLPLNLFSDTSSHFFIIIIDIRFEQFKLLIYIAIAILCQALKLGLCYIRHDENDTIDSQK